MKSFFRFSLIMALILLTTSFLVSCGKKSEDEVIKIGYAGALSGDLASYGIPSRRAAEMVINQKNAEGGLLGKQIVLLAEDDVCRPEVATNTATKLATEGVVAVIGHICSGATISALGIYNSTNTVCISPSATSPSITQSGDYPVFFRTIAPDDAQAKLQVDFALEQLNLKRIAILHDRGDYGRGLAEFARQYINEAEEAEVVLYEGVTVGAVDYTAVVQNIRRSQADAVIFGGYHPEASKILMQMRNNDMDTIFISADGIKADTFIRIAGEYAEGVYATGPVDVSTNPLAVAAHKQHVELYGDEPGNFFLNAYAATMALINAIEKAGSTDSAAIMNALRTEYIDTPLGSISFDKKGDAIGVGFSMYQVQDGVFVELP
ncbi:branched-chain amino acid transport system substrate-binding protein [Desulfobotulus alkaliphilus]|uniref:Branched-chain amino acid transport system substrate-binding protein n=1 Tax=Desulfobotulus alkaliphilus TaxID=622671 RepID=A0A562S230_9BACT|nr:branched-chain amino acid ABC transporter substrate-binding protein [Desulfobotulus alkaliphilus]TWI75401.1 branched-chain amino acid transport system substrate-binding protein [Desulfobotulus alkaliphilus]